MNKTFEIKEGNEAIDMQILTPKMFLVWSHFFMFAEAHNLPVNITNIRHKFATSKSNTHPEGRAIDVSVKGWLDPDIYKCVDFLNEKVKHLGAISFATGKPRVVYYHDGGMGKHFHLQVSR